MTGGGGGGPGGPGAADGHPFLLRPQQQQQQPPSNNDNNVGKYLLDLLRNQQQQQQQQQQDLNQSPLQFALNNNNNSSNLSSIDPAVAAVGPSVPLPLPLPLPSLFNYQNSNNNIPSQSQGFPPYPPSWPHHHHSSSPSHHTPSYFPAPHQFFGQQQHHQQPQEPPLKLLFGNVPFPTTTTSSSNTTSALDQETIKKLELQQELLGFTCRSRIPVNGSHPNRRIDPPPNWVGSPDQRPPGFGSGSGPPPGFSIQRKNFPTEFNNVGSEFNNPRDLGLGSSPSCSRKDSERERRYLSSRGDNNSSGSGLSGQLDHPGLPPGSALRSSVLKMNHHTPPQESLPNLDADHNNDNYEVCRDEVDELSEQLVDSVLAEDECDDKTETSAKKKHHRDKDFRSDARGKWILSQRMRNSRRLIECRRDITRFNAPLIAIYESLIPLEEEKAKQKQLLTLLEKLVCKEWPNAKLYVYGSCANSFGVSKSDIDICLAIDDQDINKSELLLKLADILESGNLQNVQALTRARVPIVKLMDPVTGISCDICINNVLAVVNTKLLRDYAKIDARLRQLAFLIKHWAKSRGVNETYQGTLSSYAYVLMCIHFLQQRNPPILPCLQGMEATYVVTVDDIECAYFDQVERLRDFGARNKESIAQLVWAFFNYWAYCHDYANSVISIRTGSILSKHDKDWTRRIGNDRHLICIEDPFETSHDLGRVVDKRSIRVLREEFERAAEIMQLDPNPWVALFEPYIPS